MQKNFFTRFYERYIVKSTRVFFVFITLCVVFFLFSVFNTKVAIVETFDGSCSDNRIIINEVVEYPVTKVYIYKNRSDIVVDYEIIAVERIDGCFTVLYANTSEPIINFDGTIKIDVEKEYKPLINIILGIDQRYVEKDRK